MFQYKLTNDGISVSAIFKDKIYTLCYKRTGINSANGGNYIRNQRHETKWGRYYVDNCGYIDVNIISIIAPDIKGLKKMLTLSGQC